MSLFLNALAGRNHSRPPVWLMRQAGRYMPEYRAIREKHLFLQMCHEPELAAQVTLLPIKTFGMDAAILFSDILVIPEALGVGLHFKESVGPIIERPLSSFADIQNLPSINISECLSYVAEAIKICRKQLQVPLVGFCGAPFTLACYLIEGGSSQNFKKTKKWMLKEPSSFHMLLDRLADLTIDYLHLQVKAGIQAIQIFDSWAHILAHSQFQEFSLAYLKKIVEALRPTKIPIILFCRGSSVFAPLMAQVEPSGISLDWNCSLQDIRRAVPHPIALQGNLDPDILYASPEEVQRHVSHMLKSMQGDKGYIFNLGHGIHPDTPVDSVHALVETIKHEA